MTLETLVGTYGYPALFAGVSMEGETVVLIAGYLAHSGYLRLPIVVLTAFCGAFAADQFFFQLGKRKGSRLLERRPHWQPRIDRVRHFLARYQVIAILSYRFLYGMRTITPLVIGASGFPARRFLLLNMISTALWATVVATAGYYFGHTLELFLIEAKQLELWVLFAILLLSGGAWLLHFRHRRRD